MRLRRRWIAAIAIAATLGLWLLLSGELTDDYGRTSLMRAAQAGNESEARTWLAQGARINRQVASDDLEGLVAMLGFFQEYPANQVGYTALMFAVENGHVPMSRMLLDEGADPNLVARGGDTALWLAVTKGNVEAVQLLLEKGAKPDAGGNERRYLASPLMAAAGMRVPNADAIVALLVTAGANLNVTDEAGDTPLILAVRNGNVAVVRRLVEAGADVTIRDRKAGWTALMWATHVAEQRTPARGGVADGARAEILALLQPGEAPASGSDADFQLVRAILKGDDAGVEAALKAGARAQATDQNGEPAVFLAAVRGQATQVKALIAAGASVHVEYQDRSIVSAAVAGRNADTLREVLAADPATSGKQDALWQAAVYGQADMVKLLLEAGTKPPPGLPIVHESVRYGGADVIRQLLQAGADPNHLGRGETALAAAVSYGKEDVVRVLMEHGADPAIAGASGKTPMQEVERVLALPHAPEDYKAKYRRIGALLARSGNASDR
jgi:uncharacterized protein